MEKRAYIDFAALRERVPILGVVARYGVRLRAAGDSQFKGRCPLPSHTSKASKEKETFCVNSRENVWCCHSDSCRANAGRAGGNVIDLVAAMQGSAAYEAAERLLEWFPEVSDDPAAGVPRSPASDRSAKPADAPAANKPLGFTLQNVNPEHPMIQGKGISVETARDWGIGFYRSKQRTASMDDRIVFPLSEGGRLVGYAGRTVLPVTDQNPKWRLPKGLVKSFIYGLDRCDPKYPLILGESFWLPAFMRQRGKQAAALMGSEMTAEQERALGPYRVVWLAFDDDEAGRRKAAPIAERLRGNRTVRLTFLKEKG